MLPDQIYIFFKTFSTFSSVFVSWKIFPGNVDDVSPTVAGCPNIYPISAGYIRVGAQKNKKILS